MLQEMPLLNSFVHQYNWISISLHLKAQQSADIIEKEDQVQSTLLQIENPYTLNFSIDCFKYNLRGFVTLQALAERFYWIKTATNDPFVQNIPKILTTSCPFVNCL